MSAQNTTKRHARTRRGCLTCRIRKKKCDCTRPSCTKCERLHVQCLGYASDRPDWLKGENAKEYTQAIKCFLSEYPPAKAYDDPVPYLVLKPTAEVEQALARDPNRFNPVCFDPDNATLKRWLPAPPAPSSSPKAAFSNPSTEIMGASSSFTPEALPAHSVYEAPADPIWSYTQPVADPYFYSGLFSTTQPGYGSLMSQGIATSDYYGQQDGHAVHYVSGPTILQGRMLTRARRARQDMMRLGRQ
ncbi:Fungal specific transcription factor domain [Rhizoctonia solani]|uniref:Fungal specific transcription factor domain n=1 Tax=Rhizoctonia solani TaxID=456999 RepID=A0A8H7IKL7_9AGAM|nr:Fungal specific transcription factor domain [Rhizoctonia solani]